MLCLPSDRVVGHLILNAPAFLCEGRGVLPLTPPTTSMAIKLNATYCKRLGLPGFSSHQFSVSIETELVATGDIAGEAERLYHLLQSNVDEQIQTTGFVPSADYGMLDAPNANGNGSKPPSVNGKPRPSNQGWNCTDKQRQLITSIVDEHQLDRNDIEALAVERFGKGVKLLNKVEASGLINELLAAHGGIVQNASRTNGSAYQRDNGRRMRS